MENSRAKAATVSACPVCGQRLSSGDPVCSECGAILALRMTRARRPTPLRAHFTAVHRRFAAVSRFFRDRQGFYIVTALLATALTVAVIAGVFAGRSAIDVAPRAERAEAKRSAVDGRQQLDRRNTTAQAAGAPALHETRPVRRAWTTGSLAAAGVLGVVFAALAVSSGRRRRHDRAAESAAWITPARMTQAATVGAAFCLGLAAALLVVVTMESPSVQPTAALATVGREHDGQWRGETSTLSEKLTALDARLASLESRRAAAARQQPAGPASSARLEGDSSPITGSGRAPRSADTAGEPESSATSFPAVPAHDQARTSTADVVRSPRASAASLSDRVWDDIVRDWERVRRAVRGLFPGDAR